MFDDHGRNKNTMESHKAHIPITMTPFDYVVCDMLTPKLRPVEAFHNSSTAASFEPGACCLQGASFAQNMAHCIRTHITFFEHLEALLSDKAEITPENTEFLQQATCAWPCNVIAFASAIACMRSLEPICRAWATYQQTSFQDAFSTSVIDRLLDTMYSVKELDTFLPPRDMLTGDMMTTVQSRGSSMTKPVPPASPTVTDIPLPSLDGGRVPSPWSLPLFLQGPPMTPRDCPIGTIFTLRDSRDTLALLRHVDSSHPDTLFVSLIQRHASLRDHWQTFVTDYRLPVSAPCEAFLTSWGKKFMPRRNTVTFPKIIRIQPKDTAHDVLSCMHRCHPTSAQSHMCNVPFRVGIETFHLSRLSHVR